jgi:ComF family protein
MSTRISPSLSQWLNFVQFLLLPSTCVLCQQPGQRDRDLCLVCQQRLPRNQQACPICALPLPPAAASLPCGKCLQHKRRIHATVAATCYEGEVSALVTGFKYHRQLAAGRVLTTLLIDAIRQRYREQPLPQLLLPVPLHPSRLRQRGYNQAILMANDISQQLGIACSATLVQRTRATPPQQGLSARQRRRNLRGAFTVASNDGLADVQHVALIDDVVTTMSTALEVVRALQRGRDTPLLIDLWCLARA